LNNHLAEQEFAVKFVSQLVDAISSIAVLLWFAAIFSTVTHPHAAALNHTSTRVDAARRGTAPSLRPGDHAEMRLETPAAQRP
jgi:hypothetical protein